MRTGWPGWSLEVSDSWVATDDSDCLTLERSDRGAFQLSSARKRTGNVLPEELLQFAEDGWGNPTPAKYSSFDGVVFDYTEDAIRWRRWFLRADATLLFATYNGEAEVAE